MSLYFKIISWLESHQLDCFYQKFMGIPCPGCGMQRAFIELLKGNIFESFKIYPPLLPIILMLVFMIVHVKFNLKKGAKILIIMFIFTTTLIITNYILKVL